MKTAREEGESIIRVALEKEAAASRKEAQLGLFLMTTQKSGKPGPSKSGKGERGKPRG